MDQPHTRPKETCPCLFCLTPVEEKEKSFGEQIAINYKNIVACCKNLLKDKIRSNCSDEWASPPDRFYPICRKCFNSAEKLHKVNEQLMEINKILEDLIEKFTLEINGRFSKFVAAGEDDYLSEEIKVENHEDVITLKEDTYFIREENDIITRNLETTSKNYFPTVDEQLGLAVKSCNAKRNNRKSALVPRVDLSDADLSQCDDQHNLLTSDSLDNIEVKSEGSTPSPLQFLTDIESEDENQNDEDPLKQDGRLNSEKEIDHSYFPRVLLKRLEFDSFGRPIDPRVGAPTVSKRKSAVAATENLRKIAKAENFGYRDPPVDRNCLSGTTQTVLLPSTLNVISVPVTADELATLVCKTCNKEFSEVQNLINHKAIPCNSSDGPKKQISVISTAGRAHMEKKEANKESGSVCRICGKPDILNMTIHLLSHRGEHEKAFRCASCGKGFNSNVRLKEHVAHNHTSGEDGSHVCNICGKRWKIKSRLMDHLRRHKNLLRCSHCSASFKCRQALIRHESIHNGKQFPCGLCSKSFLTENILKCHKRLYHSGNGRRQYICQQSNCNKTFVTLRNYRYHFKATHEAVASSVLECPICKKSYTSKEGLNSHLKYHGDKNFVCETCGMQFPTISGLNSHAQVHEDGNYACNICGKKFPSDGKLKSHTNVVHKMQKNLVCDKCGYKCKLKNELKRHIQIVHEKVKKFNCSICGKSFSQSNNCRKHERTHKDKTERYDSHRCYICGSRSFKDVTLLRLHQIYTHTAYTQQESHCDKCGHKFPNGLELYRHSKVSQKEKSSYTHKCVHCKEPFESRCNMLCHVANCHPGEKVPYKCQVCNLLLSSHFLLNEHLKSSECGKCIPVEQKKRKARKKKERTFVCSFCGQSFDEKRDCKMHEQTHKVEKGFAFECSFCSKKFRLKCNMQKHVRIHTGERPYQCTYCPKAFPQSDQLKTHVRIHTGEKPYTCTICEKKFSDYSTFSKHKKLHG